MDDLLLVHVQYTSMFSLLVTPRGKKFGENLVIIIACHFANEG